MGLPPSEKYVPEDGVMNYPRKPKKASAKEATTTVVILKCNDTEKHLLLRRPKTGLLANLLEFPSLAAEEKKPSGVAKALKRELDRGDLTVGGHLGSVLHQFSHLKQTYEVWSAGCEGEFDMAASEARPSHAWLTEEEISSADISTAMKKVFKLAKNGKKRKREEDDSGAKAQKKITSFFKK